MSSLLLLAQRDRVMFHTHKQRTSCCLDTLLKIVQPGGKVGAYLRLSSGVIIYPASLNKKKYPIQLQGLRFAFSSSIVFIEPYFLKVRPIYKNLFSF